MWILGNLQTTVFHFVFLLLILSTADIGAELHVRSPGDKGSATLAANAQGNGAVGQAQGKQELDGQHQRVKVPDHAGGVSQFQMVAGRIPLETGNPLPVQVQRIIIQLVLIITTVPLILAIIHRCD